MVAESDKLPWLEASFIIVAQLPYLPDLRRKGYAHMANPLAGQCYAASEALFHLSEDPLKPQVVRYGNKAHETHWYLRHGVTDKVIDLTGSQFPDYNLYRLYDMGRGCGFMTKEPSKRAQAILDRIHRYRYFRRPRDVKGMLFRDATPIKKRKAENSNPTPRSAPSG